MAKTRSMSRNQNHDASSSRKRFKTFDNDNVARWSNLYHDLLFIIMMQLRVVDFLPFSGVCKSWRLFAFSNRNIFMGSKQPMSMSIKTRYNNQDSYFCLKDMKGRKFKTILPHSVGSERFGLTCGYLILFNRKTRDFWLVNPITKHELHFPDYPSHVGASENRIKGILVFSPLISKWVFVVLHRKISICIEGKRRWSHVSSTVPILDLHYFKGKIYTLHTHYTLCELRLDMNQKRKCTLHEIKIYPNPQMSFRPQLVSSSENLYVINRDWTPPQKILQLDFGEMKWVSPENTIEEYAFFLCYWFMNDAGVFKQDSWADPRSKYKSYDYFLDKYKNRKCVCIFAWMWYFPHDCFKVNRFR